MYKLLIITTCAGAVATSIAEYKSSVVADTAFEKILNYDDFLINSSCHLRVVKLY